jgi:hypothetical protein
MAMSPREFDALCGRLSMRDRKARYNAAMITAAIYNVHRDIEKHPAAITPEEVLGETVVSTAMGEREQVTMLHTIFHSPSRSN